MNKQTSEDLHELEFLITEEFNKKDEEIHMLKLIIHEQKENLKNMDIMLFSLKNEYNKLSHIIKNLNNIIKKNKIIITSMLFINLSYLSFKFLI